MLLHKIVVHINEKVLFAPLFGIRESLQFLERSHLGRIFTFFCTPIILR